MYAYVSDGHIVGLTRDPNNLPTGWKCYKCPGVFYEGREYEVTQVSQIVYDVNADLIKLKDRRVNGE